MTAPCCRASTCGFAEGLVENASNPQALYDDLKGYLMLGEPQHLDADELAALARVEWQRLFPQDPAIRTALDKHFSARLGDAQKPRALPLDNALIAQARRRRRRRTSPR